MASMIQYECSWQCLDSSYRQKFCEEAEETFRRIHSRDPTQVELLEWYPIYFSWGQVVPQSPSLTSTDASSQTSQTSSCDEDVVIEVLQEPASLEVEPELHICLNILCGLLQVCQYLDDHKGGFLSKPCEPTYILATTLKHLMRVIAEEQKEWQTQPKQEAFKKCPKEPLEKLPRKQASQQKKNIKQFVPFLSDLGKACSHAHEAFGKASSLLECALRDFVVEMLLTLIDIKSKSGLIQVLKLMFVDQDNVSRYPKSGWWNLRRRGCPQAKALVQDCKAKSGGGKKHKRNSQDQKETSSNTTIEQ